MLDTSGILKNASSFTSVSVLLVSVIFLLHEQSAKRDVVFSTRLFLSKCFSIAVFVAISGEN